MPLKTLAIACLLGLSQAADTVFYNYVYNGADWPETYPGCRGPTQSPIDLSTDRNNTDFKWVPFQLDGYGKRYTNQNVPTIVEFKNELST